MDVLDADDLLAAVTQASKDLYLGCVSPHQTSRRRPESSNALLRCEGDIELSKDRHSGCVRAGHLDREGRFNRLTAALAVIRK